MTKKIVSVILACFMIFSLVGCGKSSTTDNTKEDKATNPTESAAATGEMPTVKLMYTLLAEPTDQAKVNEALTALTEAKLGIKLDVQVVPYANWQEQMNLITAGTEVVDIAMVFGEDITKYAAKEALVPLNDLLETSGKDAKAALGDYYTAGSVNGQIYQLPVLKNMAYQSGILLRKDLVDKYGIDVSTIKTEEDLTAVFEKVSAGEPGMYMVQQEVNSSTGWVQPAANDYLADYIAVLPDRGQSTKVTNYTETAEFEAACRLHQDWFKRGWISADVLNSSDAAADLVGAGKLFGFETRIKPGSAQEKSNATGTEMVAVTFGDPLASTSSTTSFGWGILQNTANADNAMKVLNMMYSDPEFVNLIDWGIEGVHYQKVEGYDNYITFADGVDASTSGYFHNWGFAFGNQLISYVWDGNDPELWNKMKEFNSSAAISQALGFAFDSTPVKNEYTAITNVMAKYADSITYGIVDYDSTIEEYRQELKDAGIDAYIAEKQAQLDAFLAAK